MALNMNDVAALTITEGDVRTIHDNNGQLLWGKLYYDTKYKGDTSQQTYTGKNLFDATLSNYYVTSTSAYPSANHVGTEQYFEIKPNTNYTLSIKEVMYRIFFVEYDSTKTVITQDPGADTNHVSFTSNANAKYARISFSKTGTSSMNPEDYVNAVQLEESLTPSAYEPYVGGVPAPNPDYPQAVNVVTGTQTVTISDGVSSEAYNVRLGSLELAKIGDYQDYIYKSGDDWYVHKETERVILNGSETWNKANVSFQTVATTTPGVVLEANMSGYSNYFVYHYYPSGISSNIQNGEFGWSGSRILTMRNDDCTDANAFKTWLGTHNTSVYYQLATPTDTKITDADLVSDLNAIHQFLTRYGYNASVSGNLPLIIDKTALS